MTIGPENHSIGSMTAQDRFSGGVSAFRQSHREAAPGADGGDAELVTRTSTSQELTQGPSSHGLSSPGLSSQGLSRTLESTSMLGRAGSLPSLDLQGLSEPVFHPNGWMEAGAIAESMADHPLLRGLLLELPARGAMPAPDWLDRWFEATRSILELLYVQEARRG